ncbi:MAG: 50S ribosomal protein L21 [Patescibacteria group bacterium]|jgi:large subunit ribosomal protein L21
MSIAVIKTGGKQYKVKEGQSLRIEKLDGEKDASVMFETLMIASDDGAKLDLGAPSLGEKVTGKIIETAKGKKITVVKYKNKIRYLRTKGHRQAYTKVEITKIAA